MKVRIRQTVVERRSRTLVVDLPDDVDAADMEAVRDWAYSESDEGGELTEEFDGADWWGAQDDNGGPCIEIESVTLLPDR